MTRPRRARAPRSSGRGKAPVSFATPLEFEIETIGGRGDGIGVVDGEAFYVPLVVPGDRVRVQPSEARGDGYGARLLEVISPGSSRTTPPCPYYGECGGCALQHMSAAAVRAWKRRRVVDALSQHGLDDVSVEPTEAVPTAAEDSLGGRRRATFAATRAGVIAHVGFNARGSHRVVDVDRCLLLTDALDGFIAPLRALFADFLPDGRRAQATVTDLAPGLDVVLVLAEAPGLAALERLAEFVAASGLRRLSWRLKSGGPLEPLAQNGPCQVRFGGVAVDFPPAGFLQPSLAGESRLSRLVVDGVGAATSAVDLYAGLGTFTFALAAGGRRVHAAEGDAVAVGALNKASARAGLSARVTGEARDLDRRPLGPADLAPFEAAVFDPPRPGAPAQAKALAATANLKRVVAVSCNPATFARDARFLVEGGFKVDRIYPIDQFAYSPHVEVVAWLSRNPG